MGNVHSLYSILTFFYTNDITCSAFLLLPSSNAFSPLFLSSSVSLLASSAFFRASSSAVFVFSSSNLFFPSSAFLFSSIALRLRARSRLPSSNAFSPLFLSSSVFLLASSAFFRASSSSAFVFYSSNLSFLHLPSFSPRLLCASEPGQLGSFSPLPRSIFFLLPFSTFPLFVFSLLLFASFLPLFVALRLCEQQLESPRNSTYSHALVIGSNDL